DGATAEPVPRGTGAVEDGGGDEPVAGVPGGARRGGGADRRRPGSASGELGRQTTSASSRSRVVAFRSRPRITTRNSTTTTPPNMSAVTPMVVPTGVTV